jgi:hypothetical protein
MSDIALQDDMPLPVAKQRDDMGRLVVVTWHSSDTEQATPTDRWLVAVLPSVRAV